MQWFVHSVSNLFRKQIPLRDQILTEVLLLVATAQRKNMVHCNLQITPSHVWSIFENTSFNSALIHHDNISEFKENMLYVESELIKQGHYCISKMTDSVSNPALHLYILINESI